MWKRSRKMCKRNFFLILTGILVICSAVPAWAELPREQVYELFSQANQMFRQANSITDDSEKAEALYEKTILNYEKIINDGQIKNSKLYYNLANAYFLKGDIGRAILNYNRALKLDSSDANIRKNLAFARSKRIDKIPVQTEKRVLQTLFFWHYDFSLRAKFILTSLLFAFVIILLTLMIWFGRSPGRMAAIVILGILMTCFLGSVIVDAHSRVKSIGGVITAGEVVARQGDGRNYPASFKEPLHEGTEFNLLERRAGWFHISLSDDSDAWVPDNAAELI